MTVEVATIENQTQEPKIASQIDKEETQNNNDIPKSKPVEKSSSYREESNYLSDLKEIERKALFELKSKLEEGILGNTLLENAKEQPPDEQDISLWGVSLLPSKVSEETDVILLKFLRAREFKVDEAFEMLKRTLTWRSENKIQTILDDDMGDDLNNAAYMKGTDRENHPVCYNVFGVFSNEEMYEKTFGSEEKRKGFLRWRFQFMEKGIQKLDFRPGGISSILQVYDLKNCPGPSKKEIRNATYEAVTVLQDNYPELVARNVFINVPFWYYAFYSLISPFLTQRSKSKFVVARPAKVTETLLKYIPLDQIPTQYGGFMRENEPQFSTEDSSDVSEVMLKPGSSETIEITAAESGSTVMWDLTVLGWEVSYKEEFIPCDEGSYTVVITKEKKIDSIEEPIRNSFRNNEPGKVVLTIRNHSRKKKRAFYRYRTEQVVADALG